ncbi:MAG: ubiquitin-like domain-containing protein, partial [Anaerolineales bacterium]
IDASLHAGMLVVVKRAPLMSLSANGQDYLLRPASASPVDLLAGLGLSLGPGDTLLADGALWAGAGQALPHHLALERAVDFTIQDGPEAPRSASSSARTLGEALWALGYSLYQGDRVTPGLDTPVTPALTIAIQRAQPVRVQVDGGAVEGRSTAATVGSALSELGVALVGEDYSQPPASDPLPATGLINVVRVREEILTDQTLIPFDTGYQPLPEADIDTLQQVQAGSPGVLRRLTRVRYENGAEVARVTAGETLVQNPTPLIIGYGTRITVRTLDSADGPIEYWRSFSMYATSYAAKFTKRDPASSNYGRTASGKILTKGLVAIDRNLIPFGTRMYVPGYGLAEAADIGGGVKGRFIDLGFDDWNFENWHWVVTVYFLTPVPPADQIDWIIPSTVP